MAGRMGAFCYLVSVIAAMAGAAGILVAPPAAADCIEAPDQTLSLCSQGDVRVDPRDSDAVVVTGPVYPYPCDYDYYCESGTWEYVDTESTGPPRRDTD